MNDEADVVIVGAGLAGLVAAAELVDAGRRVVILEQEPEASLGGQAFWSFGGLFFVNSLDQRRLGIRDSYELAWQDWCGSAKDSRAARAMKPCSPPTSPMSWCVAVCPFAKHTASSASCCARPKQRAFL